MFDGLKGQDLISEPREREETAYIAVSSKLELQLDGLLQSLKPP